jgi:hypothetical protein
MPVDSHDMVAWRHHPAAVRWRPWLYSGNDDFILFSESQGDTNNRIAILLPF